MLKLHVQANTVRFISLSPPKTQSVTKNAYRFWLAGILLSIVHGLLKVWLFSLVSLASLPFIYEYLLH